MKTAFFQFLRISGILLLLNCAPQNSRPQNVHREWMLVEFRDFPKELMVKNKAKLDLDSQKQSGRFTANMGCNNMFGQVKIGSSGTVKFSDVGSTMMYCEENMELETAFGSALPKMSNYHIEGHFLILSDADGNRMKFVAADWD